MFDHLSDEELLKQYNDLDKEVRFLAFGEFAAYNKQDTMLLYRLEKKLLQVRLAMQLGYLAKCQFADVMSAMRLWESIIYNHFTENKIVETLGKQKNERHSIVGAYVHEPVPGRYGWTVSIDATSLYPSIIMQNNISPECIIRYEDINVDDFIKTVDTRVPVEGEIVSANGLVTNTHEGFIPFLVKRMFDLRKKTKNLMIEKKKEEQRLLALNDPANDNGLEILQSDIASLDVAQSSFKVAANAFFGVTGLPHFKYYDYRLAEAITSSGQVFIKRAKQAIDEIFAKLCNEQGDYATYLDTDSVVGDTLVYVNGKQMPIADLYEQISDFTSHNDVTKSYVKPVSNLTTLSFNTSTEQVEEKSIEYVMKHRVQKRMYKITVNSRSVTVTEDHSIIVKRDGKYIEVKPSELTITDDEIIEIDNTSTTMTSNFEIEDLGVQDIDVYDIEVAGNHNFFGNNILVHNSCYINCSKLVKQRWEHLSETEIVDKLEQLTFKIIQPAVNTALEKVVSNMGIKDCKISFKLECIGPSIVFVAKKRYAFDILYSEGVRYKEAKMKVMGIEIVRSSTPAVVKDYLKDCLKLCLRSDEETLQKKVSEIKKEFMLQPYTNISFPRGVNGLNTYASPNSIYRKGDGVTTPIHVRAALLFNHHLEKRGLGNTYTKIAEGDKIKFVYLKMPNTIHENVIGFVDKLPEKLDLIRFVDYNTQWQKAFIGPLENITNAMGWTVEKKITLDMGF